MGNPGTARTWIRGPHGERRQEASGSCSEGNQESRQPGKANYSSGDQHYDHRAVFNIVSGPKRIVPVIKEFRDMAPDRKA